jgi:hypothetical protein
MLRKTVVARALSIAFSAAALTVAVSHPAMAQSNAAGVVYGHVDAAAGATISLTNPDTGAKRSATLDASGNFRATALPPGHYKVELVRNGQIEKSTEVDVIIGQGVEASFTSAQAAVQSVQVTGRRSRIDVTNTNNGAVFTSKELARLPVATNLTSVILLAPNTTRADAAYGGASFAGGGASENSFYLNGFPITNPLSQLGSMELPFGAISQFSVVTGGFGAEFGRSIGGVTSVTTKNGTNNWEVGANYNITPEQLKAKTNNLYYEKTGTIANKDTDGKLHYRQDNNYNNIEQYGVYVGGPIIKDKLFMFVAADETVNRRGFTNNDTTGGTAYTSLARDGWNARRSVEQRWVGKFDWNLTDNHRLEYTTAGDDFKDHRQKYGYILNPNNPNAAAELDGTPNGVKYNELTTRNPGSTGAEINALRYTGNLSDDLTLTTMYGVLRSPRGITYEGFGANPPPTVNPPSVSRRVPELNAQNLYQNFNKFPGTVAIPGEDKVKSFRLDVEYKLGQHTLRAGLDHNDISASNAGEHRSGGSTWSYSRVPLDDNGVPLTTVQPLLSGQKGIPANFGGYGTRGYYASQSIFDSITNAGAIQSAQYLEDRYQVSKNLLLTLGVRNESYSNSDGDGRKFIDQKSQFAPRLSAAWDVNGDSSLKVSGSAGRYYLQLPTQVAARAASRSTLTRQEFTYTGIDPLTGVPTGLVKMNNPFSPDGELGQAKNVRSVVDQNLKPNYQDEITLGFEKAWSPDLNFGVKGTYRRLGAGIDDSCDTRRLLDYAQKNGIPAVKVDNMTCFIFNPGRGADIWIDAQDANGNLLMNDPRGKMVHFSAADLGYANYKIRRDYKALDVFLEHPMRNGWYSKVNYTLSRSKGNMEGQTRSDTGQTDVGTSAGYDFPEFQQGDQGLLPNDRLHALKAYGFIEVTPELSLGYNALIQSGRPKTCIGTNLDAESGVRDATGYLDPIGAVYGGSNYGAEYFWCDGKPVARGSLGRMPTEKRLDLNLSYRPLGLKDLAFKVDVFNVFNSQKATARQETYDGGDGAVLGNYGEARTLQAARTVKLTVEYNHKF